MSSVARNGHLVSFGASERISFGVGLACWPREWEPDPGQLGASPRAVGVGADSTLVGALEPGQSMTFGQPLVNPSRTAVLIIQTKDSNLVLYDVRNQSNIRPIWSAYTLWKGFATRATMQPDGNFVVYEDPAYTRSDDAGPGQISSKQVLAGHPLRALWATGTNGHPGARLVLQDDGNLVVYQGTRVLWASHTNGFKDRTEIGPHWAHAFQAVLEGAVIPVRNIVAGGFGALVGDPKLAQQLDAIDPIRSKTAASAYKPSAEDLGLLPTTATQPTTPDGAAPMPAPQTPTSGYGPYPQSAGTTAGVGNLDRGGGGHGGGGHGGGHGGGGWRGGGRPGFRGRGWGDRGGAWWPYVVAGDAACATWGAPVDFPAAILPSVRTTLIHAGGDPVAVRGNDGGLYLISLGGPRLVTVRPCVAVTGVGNADDDVLRAMALDLLSSMRRGVPQSATRPVRAFAQAWNSASADTQIATDGKYTREIEGALDAALSALAPGSGVAPAAVL